jgi:hypothetical protein
LSAAELQTLLGPLAATLDFVSDNGLALVDVSVRKIPVACPKEIVGEDFSALARGNAQAWNGRPTNVPVSSPATPTAPALPPPPSTPSPPKRTMVIWVILGGVLIIGFAISVRFGSVV